MLHMCTDPRIYLGKGFYEQTEKKKFTNSVIICPTKLTILKEVKNAKHIFLEMNYETKIDFHSIA